MDNQQINIKVGNRVQKQEISYEIFDVKPPIQQQIKYDYDIQTSNQLNSVEAILDEKYELRQNTNDGSTLLMKLRVDQQILEQNTGNIYVFAQNDKDQVQEIANYLGLNLESWIDLSDEFKQSLNDDNKLKLQFPVPIQVEELLTKYCDFQGPVSRKTLTELSKIIDDDELKQKFELMGSIKGKALFKECIEDAKMNLFLLLQKYNLNLNLNKFLNNCQKMMPRIYTVSSSKNLHQNMVFLTVSLKIDKISENQEIGLASKYFQQIQQGSKILISNHNSQFNLPVDKNKHIFMFAAGAGVAPFMRFLQEQQFLMEQNQQKYEKMSLYFGCKKEQGDYIYKNEIKIYKEKQILNELHEAFSRDQDKKIYVQDIIDEEQIFQGIRQKNTVFYLCGSLNFGKSVIKKFQDILQMKMEIKEDIAQDIIKQLEKESLLFKEFWG